MKRFEKSADKLYKAFNEGMLNQNSCQACAVGNIVGHGNWFGSCNDDRGHLVENYTRKRINICDLDNESDYSISELTNVEHIFLDSFVGLKSKNQYEKKHQLQGLLNVLDYLAELDGIELPKVTEDMFKQVVEVG